MCETLWWVMVGYGRISHTGISSSNTAYVDRIPACEAAGVKVGLAGGVAAQQAAQQAVQPSLQQAVQD